jgi:hypothetical protein
MIFDGVGCGLFEDTFQAFVWKPEVPAKSMSVSL